MPPTPPTRCADCGGTLVAGHLLDYDRTAARPSEWVLGDVEASRWTGRVKNPERFEVTAYRCDRCGVLKLYATAPSTGSGRTA